MEKVLQEAQKSQDELVQWRRHLHQNPELGMELPETSAFVKGKLEEMGYEPTVIAGCGVVATIEGKHPGKCILLRADMDALPVEEQADVEFCSTNGKMHACGHDFHTTMLLGAAKVLKAFQDEMHGSVKLMFQPGEETLEGAKAMVEAGILDNPKVDAAVGMHVACGMPYPAGLVMIPGGGPFSSASDWFEILIQGKGGHGAMPEDAIDPLVVMSNLHLALQTIRSRELAAHDAAVITVGHMQGGETIGNVIPDTAFMRGTIRTYDPKIREYIAKRLPKMSEGMAETYRATADAKVIPGCPSVVIDPTTSSTVTASLKQVVGAPSVPDSSSLPKMSGSEDFAFVAEKVPSVMMLLTAGNSKEGYEYPMHHPKAKFDESVLSKGAAAYAGAALGWLENNQ